MLQAASSGYRRQPASLARQLAARPLKKGGSMERLAYWHQQHDRRDKDGDMIDGLKRDIRFVTRFMRTPDGIVPQRRITRMGHVRVDARGNPRSKSYDRRGRR